LFERKKAGAVDDDDAATRRILTRVRLRGVCFSFIKANNDGRDAWKGHWRTACAGAAVGLAQAKTTGNEIGPW
jgi:hypothetical protein